MRIHTYKESQQARTQEHSRHLRVKHLLRLHVGNVKALKVMPWRGQAQAKGNKTSQGLRQPLRELANTNEDAVYKYNLTLFRDCVKAKSLGLWPHTRGGDHPLSFKPFEYMIHQSQKPSGDCLQLTMHFHFWVVQIYPDFGYAWYALNVTQANWPKHA